MGINAEYMGIPYTLGNIVAISGSGFLVGPWRQCKSMWDSKRRIASAIYLLSIIGVLLAALLSKNSGLVLLLVIIEFFALWWYFLSYIPYGRKMVKECCSSTI